MMARPVRTPFLAPTNVKEDEGKNWQCADPNIVSAFDVSADSRKGQHHEAPLAVAPQDRYESFTHLPHLLVKKGAIVCDLFGFHY